MTQTSQFFHFKPQSLWVLYTLPRKDCLIEISEEKLTLGGKQVWARGAGPGVGG